MIRWIPVKGYPLYEVSNEGDIRNKNTGRILKQQIGIHGYSTLTLRKDKRPFTARVHRIVADSFYDGVHDEFDVNHIDGNKLNNHISNLEFCTRKENIRHAFDTGLKHGSRRTKIRVIETGDEFDSITECQSITGFDKSAICKCLSGKQDNYKGYHFERI